MAKRARHRSHRSTSSSNTYRFFVHPNTIREQDVITDDPILVHQLVNVLRLEPGMDVTMLDNSGWEYIVVLDAIERKAVRGTITARRFIAPPQLELTLYIALLKAERFEWVLQKGTEIGVAAFVPITSEHSVVDTATGVGTAKIERWERIIREASEQSRRGQMPRLYPAQRFTLACHEAVSHSPTLLLWEGEATKSLRDALRAAPTATSSQLALFSGPEGGWSTVEIATAKEYNVECVSLGPRILRAETAPIVALSAAMFEYGELG